MGGHPDPQDPTPWIRPCPVQLVLTATVGIIHNQLCVCHTLYDHTLFGTCFSCKRAKPGLVLDYISWTLDLIIT